MTETIRRPRRKRNLARSAGIEKILVSYDGPQLILLHTDRNLPMLAVAVDREEKGAWFFACEVRTSKILEQYMSELIDLHFVFRTATGSNYYLFNLGEREGSAVPLRTATPEEAGDPNFWPSPGLFARVHTEPYSSPAGSLRKATFAIDGRWTADHFAAFNAKIADIYSFFSIARGLAKDSSAPALSFLRNSILARLWRGGGSYVAFYDDLFERSQRAYPLEVSRIQYASPGEIVFSGDADVFADVGIALRIMASELDRLDAWYASIRNTLRREKLLRADPSVGFTSKSAEERVKTLADDFADAMRIDARERIFLACEKNTVVYAKVLLSLYRRSRDLYLTSAQGRATMMSVD